MTKAKIYIAIIAITMLSACASNNEQGMTDSERDAKVDSLVGTRMEEINRTAMEDLDRRMAIEVKAKADSIVQARIAAGEVK